MIKQYKQNRICPVCNQEGHSERIWHVCEVIPDDIPLPKEFFVVKCEKCGFCYADTSAGLHDYDAYYEKSNIYANRSLKTAPVYEEIMKNLALQYINKDDKILDMGCGNGKWLRTLKILGYVNLNGMDVAVDNIQVSNDNDIICSVGGVYDKPNATTTGKYDVVFLNAVVEHLLFPGKAIENMRDYLTDEGLCFIVVPDMLHVAHGNSFPSHHFHHEHINYFTIDSLDNLMSRHGFNRVNYETILEKNDQEALLVGIYKKLSDVNMDSYTFKYDETGSRAIKEYIDKVCMQMKEVETKIDYIKNSRKSVVLYGMGARMFQLLAEIDTEEINIVKCLDGNESREGQRISINNKTLVIENPQRTHIPSEAIICVCVNAKKYEVEIVRNIRECGYKNEIVII